MIAGSQGRVVVAMSGGVDSSVAAMLLREEGRDVVGVSMQVWDYRNNGGSERRASCCAPSDFADARRVAGAIGIPYYVFDFEQSFRREVIDRFVESYRSGLTPNPCIDCNNKVKFRELRGRAEDLGCDSVATGHYARTEDSPGGARLLRGRDREKDQSYFLYGLTSSELSRTIFPVGGYTKEEVRELARERGLATADKPESQDICFVAGSVRDFVVRIGGGRKKPGAIVRSNGAHVGEHEGIHQYTVGQRRGLGIGGSANPLYVLEIRPETDTVVVGERGELEREGFSVGDLNWIRADARPEDGAPLRCVAQLRHRHDGVPVEVSAAPDGTVSVAFLGETGTVSPGQAAVFYDPGNEEVLGGGRILR